MRKKMKLNHSIFCILFTASLLIACSKDGQDGSVGPQGEPGTANVIYSEWIPTEIEENPQFNNSSFKIGTRLITQEIVQQGAILVFGKHIKDLDQFVFPLPVTFNGRNTSYYYYLEEENNLHIVAASVDGISEFESTYLEEFRYVLIPGGVSSTDKSSSLMKDYSKLSYEEITKRFKIPD